MNTVSIHTNQQNISKVNREKVREAIVTIACLTLLPTLYIVGKALMMVLS